MPTPSHILVLGLGNILLTDEGLGVRAVERLAADYDLPANVEVLDGGTLGLDLLPRLEGVEALLLVDAVKAGGQPGDLVRLAGDDIQAALAVKMSVHQVGLQELLAVSAFQGTRPPRVVLWGMEPAALEWGLELSPPVAARLDALVEAISQELRAWGGVTGRTGDLAQIELPKVAMTLAADETSGGNLLAAEPIPPTTLKAAPSYLTADGAVNWEPLASYDALSDSTIGLAVRGPAPAGAASAATPPPRASAATALAADQPLVVANVGRQPNLVVVTATISARYPAPGEPLTLTVALRNDGAGFDTPLGPLVDLVAAWDGGPGLGAVAYSHAIAAPHAGQVITHTIPLAAPPPLSASAPAANYAASHTLTVAVNPTQALPEQSGADNSVTLTVGGLPPPTALMASPANGSLALLQWTAPAAGGIAGYRVYRSADGGASLPVGSSFVTGWVDLAAQPGHTYRYTVTSYAADGLEGAPSAAATAATPQGLGRLFLPVLLRSAR